MEITRIRTLRSCPAGALAAALTSCGLAAPAMADTETRPTAPFHAISVAGAWDADVTVGKPQSVVLEGDKTLLSHVTTEVVDGELRIRVDNFGWFWFGGHGRLAAHIAVPSLDAFSRAGSGDAVLTGVTGEKLSLASNGSGRIAADGRVSDVALAINGSGSGELSMLAAEKASIAINGSGDASVQAHQALSVTINGSGHVDYIGEPHLSTAIHGSGEVAKK